MLYSLNLDPRINQNFAGYKALIVYACDLANKPSDANSAEVLRNAEDEARQRFGTSKLAEHAHIAAWRQAYKSFGAKPSKFLCSVEALLNRTLKGQDLPAINYLVDLYNAVSIRHVLPVGGENWDCLTSDLTLTLASGNEPFDTYQDGEKIIAHPEPGEVVWVDSTGVTCRRWNWRQCYRTQLTTDTCNAYFVLDCLPPYSKEELMAAGEELIQHLRNTDPDCKITHEILGNDE